MKTVVCANTPLQWCAKTGEKSLYFDGDDIDIYNSVYVHISQWGLYLVKDCEGFPRFCLLQGRILVPLVGRERGASYRLKLFSCDKKIDIEYIWIRYGYTQ